MTFLRSCLAPVLILGCVTALPACGGDDTGSGPDGGPDGGVAATWHVVFDNLDRVVLSVGGRSATELFFAGGGLGTAVDGLAMRYDGTAFEQLGPLATTETYWWVWSPSPAEAFFVGTGGVIHHWNGTELWAMRSPTTATLFGVWGSSPTDVWAVGGDPFGVADTDVLLHFDGTTWTTVALPAPGGVALFKVWGFASDDIFVVGQDGTILHYDGTTWATQASGVTTTLFTVHGAAPNDVWAVDSGSIMGERTLLHYDGSTWSVIPRPGFLANGLNGIAANANGDVSVVGNNALRWRRAGGQWFDDFDFPPYRGDLHGTFIDADGDIFAVGGNFNAPAGTARLGLIAFHGKAAPPSVVR